MKKIFTGIVVVVAAIVVAVGSYALGSNHHSTSNKESGSSKVMSSSEIQSSSSSVVSSSQVTSNSAMSSSISSQSSAFDPTKQDAATSSQSIASVTAELVNAGLPANTWAPSDIQTIISQANQQGISPVDYAKQNYHK
ncbi:hypothetical protein [Fructobacillus ficulneus]|uniref:Uncharacterized protein n=1 Tax=Fructobacillus ficulneus TaxID=157463 RepID=A0A0K8MGU8_9LACO|nr:hypothetical protein [Fructobacillus ficulneus]GAO99099.1 hypothetical protein FFIC_010040 [Fructobacillus ficulneus]